jgi:PAS domain S-box-containing protein
MTGKKKKASPRKKKSVIKKKPVAKKKSTSKKAHLKAEKSKFSESTMDDDIFRIIFDNSPIGIELFDKDGYLINVNKAGLANFGVADVRKLMGFSFFDDPMFPEGMKKKLRKGSTVRYESVFDFDEARKLGLFKTKKKGIIFLDMLFTPIRTKKDKEISGYLAQVQDITERKNNEKNLKISEEKYRMIFNSVNDAVFVHGISEGGRPGKFIAVNEVACNVYGYSKEEFQEMSPPDINDPEMASDPGPVMEKLLKDKHVLFATVDVTKDGKRMPVEISSHLFELDGKPTIISSVRSITERKKALESLRESEERYRTLFETANDAILMADVETGIILDANKRAELLFDMPAHDLIGLHHTQLHPKEKSEEYRKGFKESMPKKGSVLPEMVIERKDGRVVPVEISEGIVQLKDRKVRLGIFRDITERNEAERQIRESEARFRGAFENTGVGASMVSLKGQFIKVNLSLCEMIGYSEEELLTRTFSDITHPEDIHIGLNAAKKMVAGEINNTMFEKRYVRKDGQLINVVISPTIIRDSDGNPLHFMALFQDITERKKAEIDLKESESKFRILADKSPNMIFINKMGKIMYANMITEEIMGYSLKELYSPDFNYLDLIAPEHIDMVKSNSMKHFKGEEVSPYEYTVKTKGGRRIESLITTKLIQYEGESAILGIVTDITERKKAEEEIKRSLKEKEVLLKEIHHRVKNNMAIISSLLQLQARYSNDENVTRLFRDSQSRIGSMALVHEKLYQTKDFSNINFRGYVEELVSHLLDTYGKEKGDVGLSLSVDNINLNIDTMIPCGLILNELVTNSLKYAFDGIEKPEIRISFDTNNGRAELVYGDNGIIEFPNSNSLGLQIVDMLALQLRGSVEHKRDGGTEFAISFDLRD